jgi:hypothetical protein
MMKEKGALGHNFEILVGRPLGSFDTLEDMEEAAEKALGRPLKSVTVDPKKIRRESEEIIKKSYKFLKNLE